MTDLFEQATRRGGTYTERRRQNIGNDAYKRIVVDYSMRMALATFGLGFCLLLLLNGVVISILSPERLFWILRPGLEWSLMFVTSFLLGCIMFLYCMATRMNDYTDLLFEPTERRAEINPERMESTGARTAVTTIPTNANGQQTETPRERGDVKLRNVVFFGALLDAISRPYPGLNRDRLRKWYKAYKDLQRRNNAPIGWYDWDTMTRILIDEKIAYRNGRSVELTEEGEEWLRQAGLDGE